MNLDSLRCFLAVARALHFRAAAEQVALSPAAVSDHIRRLEAELDLSLFERSTRSVALTDEGRRLLPHARQILDDVDRCRAVARGDEGPVPYALTLGTRFELGLSWLQPALGPLRLAHPARTLHLYMGDSDALLDRVERGRIDAAVLSTRLARPHLRYALLHEEDYVYVGASDGPRTAAEAAKATLVDVTPDLPLFRYLLDRVPEGAAWHFGDHLYLGGIGAVRAAILSGVGVGVLPRYFVAEDLAAGRLVALLPKLALPSDHFRLVWRVGHPRAAEIQALAAELRCMPLR